MNKWWKYITEERQLASPPRKSAAGIKKAVGRLTQTGPQTGGSPYKTVKKTMPGKDDEEDISAPPGAPGGGAIGNPGPAALEEEVEPESFELHSTLNVHFWQDDCQLRPAVAKRLRRTADDFLSGLGVSAKMVDLRFVGSLANYNWSKYSDIDLHVVVDFAQIDEDNPKLVQEYMDAIRWKWNTTRAVAIYGHEVEIYVENIGHVTHASAVYSILENKWIIQPSPEKVEFDYATARKKADSIEQQANLIRRVRNPTDAANASDRLLNKIYRMRTAGLRSPMQEYSTENIAFKILRREKTLDDLKQFNTDLKDIALSTMEDDKREKDLY